MFTQEITITYTDGRVVEVTSTQADVAAWEMYAVKRGLRASGPDRTVMQDLPVTFLRFIAWSATHRPGTGPRPDFDTWTNDVVEVSVREAEAVDPTPSTTPDD
jgi:hypothetical protein